MRAHYRNVVQDSAGNVLAGAVIAVYQPGTTTPVATTLYADGSSGTTLANPFTTADGSVSFYLASPQRVDLGVQPPNGGQILFRDLDVSTPPLSSTDWINAATSFGADPTGTADSTSAIQNALNSASPGQVVYLPDGTYAISLELTIPQEVLLTGPQAYRLNLASATLKPKSSFTGTAAVTFAAATPCGGISNMVLDGSNLPAGSVNGIDCVGGCKQGSITGVNVHNFTGHGINVASASGNPDGWYMHEITAHNNGGDGIHWDYSVDGQLDTFHLDGNGGSGLTFGSLNNCSISNGKCQQNSTYGYGMTGGFVKSNSTFSACLSENNAKDGWNFNSSSGAFGSIQLIGCSTRDDGTSGTSGSGYSGFVFNGITHADILLVGCSNYITSSAAGPDYGLNLISCTGHVNITGCSLIGGVATYHDGGGNTLVRWDNSTVATGQSDATRTFNPAPALPAAFAPADPASTASQTLVMMGLGSTCTYTPRGSGKLLVNISACVKTNTALVSFTAGPRYGTGTAPANGVAVTGTAFGAAAGDISTRGTGTGSYVPISWTVLLTGLTRGTAYWFDMALLTSTSADVAVMGNVMMSIQEQP